MGNLMTDSTPDGNRLGAETSPYLLQHKDNPVHWQPWDEQSLAQARAENKPILLSVGYAACHWCHVMAHESFENDAIAAVMNELFINIKVDREERPDIDNIYQNALAMLGQQGGWPLTMFLTPEGKPFWGGTYFPPEGRWGRPGFVDVLHGISQTYAQEYDKVEKNVTALMDGLSRLSQSQPGEGISTDDLNQVAYRLLAEVDKDHGGIGGAPKFPQVSILKQLWLAWRRLGDSQFRFAITHALDNICQGGIYDHLAGGFARYAVDERWLVPHFEKMLYDNAQLVDLMTQVWKETKSPLYKARISETITFLISDMQEKEGGFASSFDADSEGEEGKYYVWSESEVDRLLGEDSTFFKQVYDVSAEGNWEGKTILNRLSSLSLLDTEDEGRLHQARETLLAERVTRIPPGKDDKVLADWNGMTIHALAQAGIVFERNDWVAAARLAYDFVVSHMTSDDRLLHSWRDGRVQHAATLDDYAHMMRAALALFEAGFDRAYIEQAEGWAETVNRHFTDEAAGGYFFTADDSSDLVTRTKSAMDNAVPSGNGILIDVFTRLHILTGKDGYRENAESIIKTFAGELQRNFFPLSTVMINAHSAMKPIQIAVIEAEHDESKNGLFEIIVKSPISNAILQIVKSGETLPESHPAANKESVDGKTTVYICEGPVCGLPITERSDLEKALSHLK